VQLQVDHAESTLLASWPRSTAWDDHQLVIEGDGSLLLASSSTLTQQHAIAKVDIAAVGGPVVTGVEAGALPLAFPPLVDGLGYTIVLAVDPPAGVVERIRKPALDLTGGGSLAVLGAQL
jgi:hypothetical protein